MNWLLLILMPVLGGMIGWLTNVVAIKMLFRPRMPKRFLFLKFHGLIPRRQAELAEQAGQIIEQEILQRHVLKEEIARINVQPHIEAFTEKMIYEGVAPRLKAIPLLGGFVNNNILAQLHQLATEEMEKQSGPLMDKIATEAETRFDIARLAEKRIADFDLDKLEELVNQIAKTEFKTIERLGLILGFMVGLVQAGVVYLYQVL